MNCTGLQAVTSQTTEVFSHHCRDLISSKKKIGLFVKGVNLGHLIKMTPTVTPTRGYNLALIHKDKKGQKFCRKD